MRRPRRRHGAAYRAVVPRHRRPRRQSRLRVLRVMLLSAHHQPGRTASVAP